MSRRPKVKHLLHKRIYGKSIEVRPKEVDERIVFGHWEADTVLGLEKKGENVIFIMVERVTGHYLSIKINEKNTAEVGEAMAKLKEQFGDKFNQVFKNITTDNGSEFADFHSFEELGTQIYFDPPYSSWERPVNERGNRILRKFVPKGKSISAFSSDQIVMFSDEINVTPTKRLNYHTPEELFEAELDKIYKLT